MLAQKLIPTLNACCYYGMTVLPYWLLLPWNWEGPSIYTRPPSEPFWQEMFVICQSPGGRAVENDHDVNIKTRHHAMNNGMHAPMHTHTSNSISYESHQHALTSPLEINRYACMLYDLRIVETGTFFIHLMKFSLVQKKCMLYPIS